MAQSSIERVEDRTLLSAYLVNTISDSVADASGTPDGQISLREAITAANTNAAFGDAPAGSGTGDVIRFAASVASKTIVLTQGDLNVTDDLIVDGQSRKVTVSGNNVSRIFNVNMAQPLSVVNLKLINGRAIDSGGAVHLAGGGMTQLTGVSIFDSTATGAAATQGGGALYNADQTLFVRNSTLERNKATGTSGSGGAIFTASGSVSILGSTLRQNVANRAGGGVEITTGSLLIDTSKLLGNRAGFTAAPNPGNGGGVHVTGAAVTRIDSTTVFNNRASLEGGGLWNSATGSMTVNNSKIDFNFAYGDAADDGGGGIFNNGGALTVTATEIDDSVASGLSGSGGGLFSIGGTVNVTNSTISDGVANRAGGGIEIVAGDLTLNNVKLLRNVAGPAGSAMPGNGGALHVSQAANTNINNSLVQFNRAASEGGGLWNSATGSMTLTNSKVDANIASGDDATNGGGGIFNDGGTLTVGGTEIDDNLATGTSGSGGGIFSVAGTVNVTGSTISDNVANRAGGGVEVIDGTFNLANVKLIRNKAGVGASPNPGNGGGLHVSGNAATVNITDNTLVQSNRASREGGGLWNQAGSTLNVTDSKIDYNFASGPAADDGGGGVFNNGGTVVIRRTEIDDSVADGALGSGGGLFSTAGDVEIYDSVVTDNRASRAGGGIEIITGTLLLSNVNLSGNIASPKAGGGAPGNGGGLHVTGVPATTAPVAPTIVPVTPDTLVTIVDSFVRNNLANKEGGGLWNAGGSTLMTVSNTVIASNASAGTGGGGIFNNGGHLQVDNSTVERNQALNSPGAGGGLYNNGPSNGAQLTNVAFNSNIAKTGGAIFTAAGAVTTTSAVTYSGNVPDNTAGPGTLI